MSFLDDVTFRTTLAARTLWDASARLVYPSLRLGVTGLSRSGKTVFTTALIHQLVNGGDLPAFHAATDGRIRRARLAPQPDIAVPRFPYEEHLAAIIERRAWPSSTERINELRLDIEYERLSGWTSGPGTLSIDIVDYPGEWLLDLALIDTDYREWSRQLIEASNHPSREPLAIRWRQDLLTQDPDGEADESQAVQASAIFKEYLVALRNGPEAVAATPPGRFLMPGDLAGSPALTFAPLDIPPDNPIVSGTFAHLMAQRFDAYKTHVVKPFFLNHFQRIDRQIVLIDILAALDAGPAALAELEHAIDRVLLAFRIGRRTLVSRLFSPRADKVLFAATKADHIHHTEHKKLEAILRLLVSRAILRNEAAGAHVGSLALASLRATQEKTVQDGRETLKAVAGTPEAGEMIGGAQFDGLTEAAIFPGELPDDPEAVFKNAALEGQLRFPRFRPPLLQPDTARRPAVMPYIRFDRALEFLLGDRLT